MKIVVPIPPVDGSLPIFVFNTWVVSFPSPCTTFLIVVEVPLPSYVASYVDVALLFILILYDFNVPSSLYSAEITTGIFSSFTVYPSGATVSTNVYSPASRPVNANRPLSSDIAVYTLFVLLFVNVNVAPFKAWNFFSVPVSVVTSTISPFTSSSVILFHSLSVSPFNFESIAKV